MPPRNCGVYRLFFPEYFLMQRTIQIAIKSVLETNSRYWFKKSMKYELKLLKNQIHS
jgi:hypothetical protein